MVIENDGGDRGEKARSSSDECFSDAGCDSAKAGSACAAEPGKGINDAPNGSEEANERRDRARSGEPGHSLFDAANFFRGSKLHAYGYRLQTLEPWRGRVSGNTPDLVFEKRVS